MELLILAIHLGIILLNDLRPSRDFARRLASLGLCR
jgi:hypothetical protein